MGLQISPHGCRAPPPGTGLARTPLPDGLSALSRHHRNRWRRTLLRSLFLLLARVEEALEKGAEGKGWGALEHVSASVEPARRGQGLGLNWRRGRKHGRRACWMRRGPKNRSDAGHSTTVPLMTSRVEPNVVPSSVRPAFLLAPAGGDVEKRAARSGARARCRKYAARASICKRRADCLSGRRPVRAHRHKLGGIFFLSTAAVQRSLILTEIGVVRTRRVAGCGRGGGRGGNTVW